MFNTLKEIKAISVPCVIFLLMYVGLWLQQQKKKKKFARSNQLDREQMYFLS